eukprot:TRINITY_DN927_c4_g1_i1.p1 TRINITY_DN927_c4_g1~~TRINITY_DN927_c4_g1_i1.p1  ORF type:complete len:422 (-),score=61.52 TRINITY_DN927_c4_g1_i1:53-1318(-)
MELLDQCLLAILILYSVFVVVICSLVALRRTIQPLRFRAPWLLLLSGLGGYVGIVWLIFYLISDSDESIISRTTFCHGWEWVQWFTYPTVLVPYILRNWRVFRIFSLPNSKSKVRDGFVIQESFLLKTYFLVLICLMGIKMIVWSLNTDCSLPGYDCSGAYELLWIILSVCEILLIAYALYFSRKVRDDYGTTWELTLCCIVWVACIVGVLVTVSVRTGSVPYVWLDRDSSNVDIFLETNVTFVVIRNAILFFISVAWPLFQTYYEFPVYVPLWPNGSAIFSLDGLLKDIICIQYFRNFLETKHEENYLSCWVEIELFKDEHGDMKALAASIFNKYLADTAPEPVNISVNTKKRAWDELMASGDNVTADIFVDVQRELVDFMQTEYPLFVASEECQKCLGRIEQEEELRDVLVDSFMINPF